MIKFEKNSACIEYFHAYIDIYWKINQELLSDILRAIFVAYTNNTLFLLMIDTEISKQIPLHSLMCAFLVLRQMETHNKERDSAVWGGLRIKQAWVQY